MNDMNEKTTSFENELERAINRHYIENESDTPDYILAMFLRCTLDAWNVACRRRDAWSGHMPRYRDEPSDRAKGIAARIWCDQDMSKVCMDVDSAMKIATILDRVIKADAAHPAIPEG